MDSRTGSGQVRYPEAERRLWESVGATPTEQRLQIGRSGTTAMIQEGAGERLELAAEHTPSPAGVPATAAGWFREDCLGSTYLLDGTRVFGVAPHGLFRIGVRAVDADSITIDLRDLRFDCVNGAPERGECSAKGPPRRRRPLSQGQRSGSGEIHAPVNPAIAVGVVQA